MGDGKHKKDKKDKKEKKEKKDKKEKKEHKVQAYPNQESEKKNKKDKSKERHRSRENNNNKKQDFAKPRNTQPRKESQPKQCIDSSRFRFDSPPRDPLQNTPFAASKPKFAENVQFGEYESILPTNPLLNPLASLEALQAMTPLIQMQRLQQLRAQADVKADRKLYVGNLPPTTQAKELQDFLNQTLLKMGVSSENAGSICNCWIDTNGHFGFIEFRNPEEATQGFILKDVIFRGHGLKIGRPKSFLTQLAAANAQMMNEQPCNTLFELVNPLSSFKVNDKADMSSFVNFRPLRLLSRYVQIPTNILVIKNVLTLDDVTIDEEYYDIVEDIKEECRKFGNVKSVVIPRPELNVVYPGVGKIYVEYEKVQEARTARRVLDAQLYKYINGRLYGDKTIECGYMQREKWERKVYTELNDDIEQEKEEQQKIEMIEQDRIRKVQYEEYQKSKQK